MTTNIGVHATHCCVKHGCKYGPSEKCPVSNKEVEQEYPCEDCTICPICHEHAPMYKYSNIHIHDSCFKELEDLYFDCLKVNR